MANQTIRHKLDVLTFGKHKGKTIRWIIEHDPSYLIYLGDEKIIEIPQEFIDLAEDNILDQMTDIEY